MPEWVNHFISRHWTVLRAPLVAATEYRFMANSLDIICVLVFDINTALCNDKLIALCMILIYTKLDLLCDPNIRAMFVIW